MHGAKSIDALCLTGVENCSRCGQPTDKVTQTFAYLTNNQRHQFKLLLFIFQLL